MCRGNRPLDFRVGSKVLGKKPPKEWRLDEVSPLARVYDGWPTRLTAR
jgi:hypothetical protein